MAQRVFLTAIAVLAVAAPAAAQQAPCRSVYLLGETVPPHCRVAVRSDLPAYRQWGSGSGTAAVGRADPAPLFDRRFQGGYNSAYGFGR